MWEPQELTSWEIERCLNTISPNTFHMIVGDSLVRKKGLSVVRFGEGEKKLYECIANGQKIADIFPKDFRVDWISRIGIDGITESVLHERMIKAAHECDYFAPFISGITNPDFDLYFLRKQQHYLDNFFINFWNEEQIVKLYKQAKKIVFLHLNPDSGAIFKARAHQYLNVDVHYQQLSNWRQSENIIKDVSESDASLVLFSGGPASKYISPEIAKSGKVVLDVGNSADRFILLETEKNHKS